MHIRIRKGLDLPIAGEPEQVVREGKAAMHAALLGADYPGIKPRMLVSTGDEVRLGQALFVDKQTTVPYTSPAGGTITSINRGAKRALVSVVVRIDDEQEETFSTHRRTGLAALSRAQVQQALISSGLWTAFRARPYGKVPAPDTEPHTIFVTAMDTNPLAPDPEVVVREHAEEFADGLTLIGSLTDGKVFLCAAPGAELPTPPLDGLEVVRFSGPHPAGLPGTHIHFLDPVTTTNTVWHVGYQDVIAIGKLFVTGRLWTERVISLAGPSVARPRLVRARLGASTIELLEDELGPEPSRVVSGSVLSGRRAADSTAFLGRYHNQISVLQEGGKRELLAWIAPGADKFSGINAFVSSVLPKKRFRLDTSQNGSPRAMVPIGNFEGVMPLDILPTPLLKALLVRDTDAAQALGCLELDEEDLAALLLRLLQQVRLRRGATRESHADREIWITPHP